MDEQWINKLEKRKFNWINLALVGITANIILITQGAKNLYFVYSIFLFSFISLLEAIGLWVIDNKHVGITKGKWYIEMWFYKTTTINVSILFLAVISLIIGTLILYK